MAIQRRDFCFGAAAGGVLLSAAGARAAGEVEYMQVVFSDPKSPDLETEFDRWYARQHIPDMFHVPGMQTIQRLQAFRAATPSSTLPRHITLYAIRTATIEDSIASVPKRKAKGLNPDSPTFDHEGSRSIIYQAAGPTLKPGPDAAPARTSAKGGPLEAYAMVVLVNPTPPQDGPPDTSHDAAHLQDVFAGAGMTSARLYSLYRPMTKAYNPPTNLAVWQFMSGDIDATLADLAARRNDGRIKPLKRWSPDHVQVYYCKQMLARDAAHPKG